MKEKWKISMQCENNASIDDLKYIFNQAEKRLESTIKNSDNISTKTYTLLTALLAIITALCAYFISNWKSFDSIDNKQALAVLTILYAIMTAFSILKNVLPVSYHPMGTMPKDIFVEELFSNDANGQRIKNLYLTEIESYNDRIKVNWSINDRRWKRYTRAVKALFCMPFILTILFLILEKINP